MTTAEDPPRFHCDSCGSMQPHVMLRRTEVMIVLRCEKCQHRKVLRRAAAPGSTVMTDKMTAKEARIRRAVEELTTDMVNDFFKNPDAFVDTIPLLESAMNGGPAGPVFDTMTSRGVFRYAWLMALYVWMQALDRWRFVKTNEDGKWEA